MKKFALFLCILSFTAFAWAGTTVTIDFETDGNGNPTFAGEVIDGIYSNLGATFTNGILFQCGGGCPPPTSGLFASSPDLMSQMRVDFSALQTSVSFDNVTNSNLLAQAFDSMGNLVASLTDDSGTNVDMLTLSGANIAFVTFQGDGDNSGQFGIDDLTFMSGTTPIPEPGSLMLLGTGILGAAGVIRRKLS